MNQERRKNMEKREIKRKATFSLPEAIIQKVKEEAKNRHLNMSVFVQLALEEYCRKEEKSDK